MREPDQGAAGDTGGSGDVFTAGPGGPHEKVASEQTPKGGEEMSVEIQGSGSPT